MGGFFIAKNLKVNPTINPANQTKENDNRNQESANCLPVFSREFTDFSKISAFGPIGSITGASRGRSYITVIQGETVPVYAPMDATLVAIIYAYRGPDEDHGEYGFKFDTKCGITFLLDHLDSATEEMKKYAPALPARTSASNDNLAIMVKAGTLLGYTNGTSQARTFDFLVIDNNKKASYINPARWQWEQSLYAICPYDFYTNELKQKYYQKIGLPANTSLIKSGDCGHISYDIPNTISGGWFLTDGATDIKGEFMLIGERLGVVDLVVKNDSEFRVVRISDYRPIKLPKDVGIGRSVCYRGFDNDWAYVNLVSANSIQLASGKGDCPVAFPDQGIKTYYR